MDFLMMSLISTNEILLKQRFHSYDYRPIRIAILGSPKFIERGEVRHNNNRDGCYCLLCDRNYGSSYNSDEVKEWEIEILEGCIDDYMFSVSGPFNLDKFMAYMRNEWLTI